MISTDILILGCGWAGISATYHLLRKGVKDVVCIDSDTAPGGLMKTVELNGIIVNGFNPEDYADALEELLTDEKLWLKLSRNGLEFVKQFNYIEIAKKYVSIVSELL
jgi:protoporphyrinogen oxidase